ncbi:TIGR03118 family protein [Massilia sp. W12]|uniref:TIGR03118 family protein n=1 Tax=Massilia sp. W12 TaxID=3126507 RepID=UPI0030CDE5E9
MKRREFNGFLAALAGVASVALSACGASTAGNRYQSRFLAADSASLAQFNPELRAFLQRDEFINAWGISIRPAGAGGHFWVTAGQYSFQFVGDVSAAPDPALRRLFQDDLKLITLPGVGEGGFATGTVFNGAPLDSRQFWIEGQPVQVDGVTRKLSGSARFLFATDGGVVSGWTERDPANPGRPLRRDGPALAMIDDSANGAAFFGMAIRPDNWSTLWLADFGRQPRLRQFNDQWQETALQGFRNPFASGVAGQAAPGDYAPFNVQVLTLGGVPRVFVAYAKTQADAAQPGQFLAGEEDALDAQQEGASPDRGKVVMYSLQGELLRVFDDQRLNAPWGMAIAPEGFGALSGCLLVGNFGGSGRIAAYDVQSGRFYDWLRDAAGKPVAIPGLWGLQFGNGASLGDSNALYFAAGPDDEKQGVFGALRYQD